MPTSPKAIDTLLRGCGLPRLEARMLLERVSGWSRAYVMTHGDAELPSRVATAFHALVERRLAGEPMAYMLGQREFYGRDFRVTPAVLIPRADTELLVDCALARCREHERPRVLDLGTGSGCIAITLALECPAAEVWALDVSAEALAVARGNGLRLGAAVQWLASDWWQALPEAMRFDVVVSNPPYIEAADDHLALGDLRFEPAGALTDGGDGLACLRALYANAPRYLQAGGWIFCEHGFAQGAACRQLALEAGLQHVSTALDIEGRERVTGGVWLG